MNSVLARAMFGEPGCTCVSLKERMLAELEQIDVPLCALHDADEIAARQVAAEQVNALRGSDL